MIDWKVDDRAIVADGGWGKPAEVTVVNVVDAGVYIQRWDGRVALVDASALTEVPEMCGPSDAYPLAGPGTHALDESGARPPRQ